MAGGKPPIIKSAEEMQSKIDKYFANETHLTITGLALSLGFESRQSIYDYEKNGEYSYIIKTARLRVENAYEIALMSHSSSGAIFALKNMNWSDRLETNNVTTNNINVLNVDPLED
tara:strand:- start:807 stop:1154 length:348 start_codon:yes stop_codon:yes gene_type:complete